MVYPFSFARRSRRSLYRARKAPRRNRHRRRRRRRTTGQIDISRGITAFPPSFKAKLKYADIYTASTAGGSAVTTRQFNLNSVYDPDLTGTGHQPYGHDQLIAIYNRYRVYRTSWQITLTGSTAFRSYVMPQNSSGTYSTWEIAAEKPRAISQIVSGVIGMARYRGHISLPRLNGVTSTAYKSDDRFQAIVGSSPAEIMTLNIGIDGDGGQVVQFGLNLILCYYVEFFDPLILGSS